MDSDSFCRCAVFDSDLKLHLNNNILKLQFWQLMETFLAKIYTLKYGVILRVYMLQIKITNT